MNESAEKLCEDVCEWSTKTELLRWFNITKCSSEFSKWRVVAPTEQLHSLIDQSDKPAVEILEDLGMFVERCRRGPDGSDIWEIITSASDMSDALWFLIVWSISTSRANLPPSAFATLLTVSDITYLPIFPDKYFCSKGEKGCISCDGYDLRPPIDSEDL